MDRKNERTKGMPSRSRRKRSPSEGRPLAPETPDKALEEPDHNPRRCLSCELLPLPAPKRKRRRSSAGQQMTVAWREPATNGHAG